MQPDFSPAMLKSFLAIRIAYLVRTSYPSVGASAEKAARTELRKRSCLTRAEFDLALAGKLKSANARGKIWAALWVHPATFRIRLLDNGRQERADAA